MRPRVSILGLMAAVALIATGLVALRSTSEVWASAYFSLTLLLLCTAVPGMAFQRGGRRAFWVGVAAFGGPYFILCFGPIPGTSLKPPPLLTTKLLERLYPHVSTVSPQEVAIFGKGVWEDSRNIKVTEVATMGRITFFRNDTEDFLRTGHSLFSLILSASGGMVARSLAVRRDGPEQGADHP